jgi:uncharacterized protein (TIRG00374 family)
MNPRIRQIFWLLLRLAVSAGCVAWVLARVDFHDRVVLADGTEVVGWITRGPDAQGVAVAPAGQGEQHYALDQLRRTDDGAPVVHRGFLHVFRDVFTRGNWLWFAAAVAAYTFSPWFGAVRWRMLLNVQQIHLTFREALRLTYVCFFFNTFMLGLTGGDVVKAYYATRHTETRKAEAVTTVFLDRIIGLFGMALLCICALAFQWTDPALRQVRSFILLFLAVAMAAGLVFYSRRVRRWMQLERIRRKLPLKSLTGRLGAAVTIYREHRLTVVWAVLLSWGAHLVSITSVYLSARALGLDPAPLDFLIYMPVIWIAGAVVPSVGGLGVMEGLAQRFFTPRVLGVATRLAALNFALAFMLLFRAAMFLAVLPGGVLNILTPTVSVREARHELDQEAASNA